MSQGSGHFCTWRLFTRLGRHVSVSNITQLSNETMSTRILQVILFPEDELAPRLVPLEFKLEERKDRPGVFPCTQVAGELDRVLANGRVDLPSIQDIEHHIIVPRLAGIDSDQMYCTFTCLVLIYDCT